MMGVPLWPGVSAAAARSLRFPGTHRLLSLGPNERKKKRKKIVNSERLHRAGPGRAGRWKENSGERVASGHVQLRRWRERARERERERERERHRENRAGVSRRGTTALENLDMCHGHSLRNRVL